MGTTASCPGLTGGPFRYRDLRLGLPCACIAASTDATRPMKQAVIAPSMMLLPLTPLTQDLPDYTREQFEDDIGRRVREGQSRQAFAAGGGALSIDFTKGRLATGTTTATPGPGRTCGPSLGRAEQPGCYDRFSPQERLSNRHPHLPGR